MLAALLLKSWCPTGDNLQNIIRCLITSDILCEQKCEQKHQEFNPCDAYAMAAAINDAVIPKSEKASEEASEEASDCNFFCQVTM